MSRTAISLADDDPRLLAEYHSDQYPRQRENTRKANQTKGISMTTTYTRVDDDTEEVHWTNDDDGTGYSWRQTWVGGLDNAPDVGDLYLVLHDEWFLDPDTKTARRIIHEYQSRPDPADA